MSPRRRGFYPWAPGSGRSHRSGNAWPNPDLRGGLGFDKRGAEPPRAQPEPSGNAARLSGWTHRLCRCPEHGVPGSVPTAGTGVGLFLSSGPGGDACSRHGQLLPNWASDTAPGTLPEGAAGSCPLPNRTGDRGTGAPPPPAPTRTPPSECHPGPSPFLPVPRLWMWPLLELTSTRLPSLPHTKNGGCVLLGSSS